MRMPILDYVPRGSNLSRVDLRDFLIGKHNAHVQTYIASLLLCLRSFTSRHRRPHSMREGPPIDHMNAGILPLYCVTFVFIGHQDKRLPGVDILQQPVLADHSPVLPNEEPGPVTGAPVTCPWYWIMDLDLHNCGSNHLKCSVLSQVRILVKNC